MTETPTETLKRSYAQLHDAVLLKLDGLSERELRSPHTPTGTNLLGVVKHLSMVEFGYFGDCFGRSYDVDFGPAFGPAAPPNADMYATPDQSAEQVIGWFTAAGQFAQQTFDELDLDSEGRVSWWPAERNPVTLHLVAVHLLTDICRHAGHLDIIREQIDGSAGLWATNSNLPDQVDWPAHLATVQQIADGFDPDDRH